MKYQKLRWGEAWQSKAPPRGCLFAALLPWRGEKSAHEAFGEFLCVYWQRAPLLLDRVGDSGTHHVGLDVRRNRVGAGPPFVKPVEAVLAPEVMIQERQRLRVPAIASASGEQ
jgi:hypothetical protein